MSFRRSVEESYKELMTKVTWPTLSELQTSAGIVMIATVIIALLVLAMDASFRYIIIELIYGMFGTTGA
ncbi:MAG: preprotein translocase subunit SecE [Bacteroidales bacterium]